MESRRRLIPLILSFLFITVVVAGYALGLGDMIDNFDIRTMEQSFKHYNWNYSH
ncbi:MAG TPA: hypothetical protein VNW99_11195 [Cytophagaceae bacterium]|jgi:hypothetical protein|nr:hypothetical protein [Cytophagaceae bacterium]